LAEGIAVVDNQGTLAFVNTALEQLLGYGHGELVGQPWEILLPDEVTPQSWLAERIELRLQCQDGTAIPVLATSRPLHDRGRSQGVLMVFADQQERRRLGIQIREMEKAASAGQHLSGVVHELKNSLTILILQSQMLGRQGPLPSPMGESVAIIQSQASRMKQMLDNLRTSSDPHQLHLEAADVNELLHDTLVLLEHQLQTHGIRVTLDLAADLPTVHADPYKLQQVFINLINNARQAIASVGEGGTLILATKPVSGAVRISFTDDGPGIDAQIMPHIFEPFFTTKESDEGMGLGLAICEQIVTRHGGRIWAENAAGGGAILALELPLDRPYDEPEAAVTSSEEHHVLIVDDEPQVLRAVSMVLRNAGFHVSIAQEARQALDLLDRQPIDLVLSDLSMPTMDGMQFWQAASERHPHLADRIIFASGDTSSKQALHLLQRQGCTYIEKPFGPDELVSLIQQVLALSR